MSSPAKLNERVSFLASEKLAGRAPGTQGDIDARAHIEGVFACLGLEPGGDGGYQQAFTNSNGAKTANVIGILPGTDASAKNEIVIVSAHHDHFGTLGNKGLRLGANDNGSGVAGVLATAIALKQQGGLRRTVAFITFGAEETSTESPYTEGSAFLVAHPTAKLPLAQIVTVVNMDMIGTWADANSLDLMGTAKGTPGRRVLDAILPEFDALNPNLEAEADEGDSDFDPFCRKGIPYVGFYTDDPDCYHESCDVPSHLDYDNMSTIVQLVTELTADLANDPADLIAARRNVKDACQFTE